MCDSTVFLFHKWLIALQVTVMRHKFLKSWSFLLVVKNFPTNHIILDWDDERDAIVYPPDSGKYSVFTRLFSLYTPL